MKNFWKKIAITLTLVMTFALCFAFTGCTDKEQQNEEDTKIERIYELILDVAYKFKNPSSVRIISGKVNYGTTDTDNPPYEFRNFELEKGYYINANLRLSATNGFGATTTDYYHIIYDSNGKLSIENLNDSMKDTMDMMDEYPYLKSTLLPVLQTLVDWYEECELRDNFNIDKVNGLLDKKWNR